jgi:sugar (pentulose or hexulose) kinase
VTPQGYCLGIDFGTSGARAIALAIAPPDPDSIAFESHIRFTPSDLKQPQAWKMALYELLADIPPAVGSALEALAINGTSSTVLLCDQTGEPITEPLLYNDGRGTEVLDRLATIAPPDHGVQNATSSLAKLLWWEKQFQWTSPPTHLKLLHQADWLGFWLHGHLGISDYHNALKLGYNPQQFCYPDWLQALAIAPLLPQVVEPGQIIAPLLPEMAQKFNLNPACQVCAGTTDSIAAFLASGATHPGEAVTSLGSTLVIKLLSQVPVVDSSAGIYSHRLGDLWLVGGASNTGGAVLRSFFSDQELTTLSQQINPQEPTHLDYYPLLQPGERFPINDPHLAPRLTPRPDDPVQFLQGLLESMARIEAQGYQKLTDAGANALTRVYTAGGGAKNTAWTAIRQQDLGVPVTASPHTEAAYGTALLAKTHSRIKRLT